MTRQSMTGFATIDGAQDLLSWQWEIRSVNGRGLDLRIRLADGFERLEREIRAVAPKYISRGNVSLSLKTQRREGQVVPKVNDAVLDAILLAIKQVNESAEGHGIDTYPTSAADLLALRGVIDYSAEEKADERLIAEVAAQIPVLFKAFRAARVSEGVALQRILSTQIDQVESLTLAAKSSAEARRAKSGDALREKVAALVESTELADAGRLQQELALIAVKADVTEEIDRLKAHIEAARELLAHPKPIGRKFDFLMQEFNREANTLCSKSGSTELTTIGLDLKTVIDQMREQVQNLE